MTGATDNKTQREALVDTIASAMYQHSSAATYDPTCGTCARERRTSEMLADAVLASDWLATHVREQVEAALGEVERRIEAKRAEPDQYGRWAKARYTAALTDAMRLVRDYRKERTDG